MACLFLTGTQLCDAGAGILDSTSDPVGYVMGRSYTGYIDIEAKHIFFYFFESRNDPAKDEVILWTNGGKCGGVL